MAAVARAAADAGACFLFAGALFLKPCSLPTFFEFVREHFPQQLAAYQRRYNASAFVSVGVCPITGGVFRESYAICAPIDRYFPVDVNVPGCPPRPPAIIEGVAKAIAIWRQRL